MKLDMYLPSNIPPCDLCSIFQPPQLSHRDPHRSTLSTTTDPAVTCLRFDFNDSKSAPDTILHVNLLLDGPFGGTECGRNYLILPFDPSASPWASARPYYDTTCTITSSYFQMHCWSWTFPRPEENSQGDAVYSWRLFSPVKHLRT